MFGTRTLLLGFCCLAAPELALAVAWIPCGNHEYTLVTTQRTWADAETYAESTLRFDPMGSHSGLATYLASFTSAQEETCVRTFFGIAAHGAWIGGWQDHSSPNYSEPAGGWKWISGEPFGAYSNWNAGEPNNQGTEDWISWGTNGSISWWNDQFDGPRISIVERVPEPGTALLIAAGACILRRRRA